MIPESCTTLYKVTWHPAGEERVESFTELEVAEIRARMILDLKLSGDTTLVLTSEEKVNGAWVESNRWERW